MKRKYLIILASILFLFGCSQKEKTNSKVRPSSTENEIVLLQSNLLEKTSKLEYYNYNLKKMSTTKINANGLEQIIPLKEKKILIPGSYNSELIHISSNKVDIEESRYPSPLSIIPYNDGEITLYNYDEKGDINFYTYQFVRENKKIWTKRFEGVPFLIRKYDDNLFVYIKDMKTNDESSSYSLMIIDLKRGTVDKKINIHGAYIATEILKKKNYIYISLVDTNNSNSFVIRYTNGTWKEKRIKIKETGIVKMFMDNEYFYTLHYKENNTLLVKHSKNLDRDIKIVKIKKGISNPILDTEKNILFYTYVKNDKQTYLASYNINQNKEKNSVKVSGSIQDIVLIKDIQQ